MNYDDIDFNNIKISEFNMSRHQTAYISYYDPRNDKVEKMIMECDWIKICMYGIPHLNKNYINTDEEREYIQIPLDLNQPSAMKLKNHLELMDKWANSDEVRYKLFGDNMNKYAYEPLVKEKMFYDNNDHKQKLRSNNTSYVKMKFKMDLYGPNRTNKTMIVKLENGKRNILDANTITEIAKEITFLSDVKIYFHYTKIWAIGIGRMTYGIGIKIKTIEVKPNSKFYIDFSSSDDEQPSDHMDDVQLFD